MRYLSVKNFDRFQHYRDRRPPWIKLYVELLNDYEFTALSDVMRYHVMGLWIIASQTDNKIPYDAKWIARELHATSKINLDTLIEAGWLEEWQGEEAAKGKRADWASRYVSAEMRARVMERGGHKCAHCGSTKKLEIDHIIPISKGGTGDEANLQVLCRPCNRKKRVKIGGVEGSADAPQNPSPGAALRSPETEGETEAEPETEITEHSPRAGAAVAEEAFRAQMGEHIGPVLAFLDKRPANARQNWFPELLRLIGPATGVLPEDLAGACSDALLVDPPASTPVAIRSFVTRRKVERLKASIPAPQLVRGNAQATDPVADDEARWSEALDVASKLRRHAITADEFNALPEAFRHALRSVGGWKVLDEAKPSSIPYLRRDFLRSYRAAQTSHAGAA